MALYTVSISSAGSPDVVSLTDGSTYATLEVSAGRGPKGDGWTGVTYDSNTGRFTFTSTDGLGYVSDSITADLDTAVTDAEAAQAAAEAAQAATENIFDQFGDQYLGPKASDPTVDNDGDPLTEGDIYFNTTDDVLKFYSGSAWVAPESIATTAATAAQAAQTAAETAETNAETAETNAATSASNASTSETNAANSATAAAASATEAQGYADSINPDNIDINGGTIDGTVIGGSTAAAGSFTTLSASTSITGTLATAAQTNITSVGALTGLTVSGSTSLAGASTSADITFGDNDKAIFGAGSDLQIYHDGSNSYIQDAGTGNLNIQANQLRIQTDTGENFIECVPNAQVVLRYDNAVKMQTTSTGIDVTGTVTADGLVVDTATQVTLGAAGVTNGVINCPEGLYINIDSDNNQADTREFRLGKNGTGFVSSLLLQVAENGDVRFYEDTGTTPKFFWDASAERLGIGTSSPSNSLHVNSGTVNQAALFESSDATVQVAFADNSTTTYFPAVGAAGQDLFLKGGGSASRHMTIDSSGNVGIGTSSPAFSAGSGLRIERDATATLRLQDTGAHGFEIRATSTAAEFYSANAKPFTFETGGSERMRIDSSGNLLVSSTSTDPALDGTAQAIALRSDGRISARGTDNFATMTLSRGGTDGNVISFYKATTLVGSISVSASATAYNTSSDYRLKEDVQPVSGASGRVLALNPVNFAWKANGTRVDGFLAHEAQEVVPEAVTGEKDGEEMQSIDQSKLVPLLTAALQEALTKIDALEARITTLEG